MTKHFQTTFTNTYTGKQVVINTRITDKMEERGTPHKKALAIEKAVRKFEKDHVRYIHSEERGTTNIVWKHSTVLLPIREDHK